MPVGGPGLWALPPQIIGARRWRRGAAAGNLQRRHYGSTGEARLPSTSMGYTLRFALVLAAETVKALALTLRRLSAQRSGSSAALRALVMAVGEEAIFAEACLTAVHASARLTPEGKSSIGLISFVDQARSAFGVGLPFGRIEADALHALADISERYGDGNLRTTPWRALLLTGLAAADAERLSVDVEALGLIADPADPASTSSPVSRAVLHERQRRCARRCRPPRRRYSSHAR